MSTNTIHTIGREFAKAFLPLKQAISSREEFTGFVFKLGWDISDVPAPLQDLMTAIVELEQAFLQMETIDEPSPQDIEQFLTAIQGMFNAIKNLETASFEPALIVEQFNLKFPRQLISFLLIDYLSINQPRVLFPLKVLGIVKEKYIPASGNRPSYMNRSLDVNDLPKLLEDPFLLFENAFGWRTDNFNFQQVNSVLAQFTRAVNIPSSIESLDSDIAKALDEQNVNPGNPIKWALNIPFFSMGSDTGEISSGIVICGLPKTTNLKPGLAILPYFNGSISKDFEVATNLFFTVTTSLELAGGIALTIRPEGVKIIKGFKDPTVSELHGELKIQLANRESTNEPIILIGSVDGSNLQYQSLSFNGGMIIEAGTTPDIFIEAAIQQGKLVVKAKDGDSFLKRVLPADGFAIEFDTAIGLSSLRGFYFNASSGLEIQLPTHIELGPISLQQLTIEANPKDGKLPLLFGADIKGQLGPITIMIRRMGMKATFSFPDNNSGNLGPLQLDIGFKPPTGIGLTVDVGGIKGGGVLDFNPEKKEYFGALELEFQNRFTLKAFGIINTQLPDGSPGFSLLIIVTAEFSPIQLGYGFTLNGVGGLLGVNRTTKVDVLKEGLKTNTLKSILFPEDIVANINRIVSDIKQVFPPQNGRFLICPMGKIGWGASIITLEVGILIEIPVTNIKILGVLKVVLPNDKEPLLKLQVNFLGIIDFENKLISFDAFHYDSRILTFTITGQMALRIDFRNDVFIISSGGFHPAFKEIPDDLTNMERITISLYDGENARIISQNYFAITSNTIQYGLKAELFAGSSSGFNIYGHISFDIIFKDIDEFIADFGAGVALRRGTSVIMGINVSGRFTGLSPLDIRGEASVSFFFFSVSVPFHVRIGNPVVEAAKALAHLIQILKDEINDDRNWIAKLPVNNKLYVTTRTITLNDSIAVHPFGILCFSERIVPLEIEIKKFGYQLPKDANKFQLKINDPDLKTEDATEQFAPANFFEMTDEEKLSRPSFEQMKSGFKITGSAQLMAAPRVVKKPVDYEFSYLGKKKKSKPDHYKYPGNFFKANTKSAAISQSSLSHQNNRVSINAPELVEVIKDRYVIANISDMKLHKEDSVADSYTEALQQYNNLILEKPELKGQIQVLAEYELN